MVAGRVEKARVVTSCSECHRRKQKCDRLRPCNFCSIRGVPNICNYRTDLAVTQNVVSRFEREQSDHSPHPGQVDFTVVPAAIPKDLLHQVGYAPSARSDVFKSIDCDERGNIVHDPIAHVSDLTPKNQSRHEHLLSLLPGERTITMLIDFHFSHQNWSFPIIDKHHFLNLFKAWKENSRFNNTNSELFRTPDYLRAFPALLFSTLAISLQFIPPRSPVAFTLSISCFSDCDRISSEYSAYGHDLMSIVERRDPTTVSIQYDLSRAMWLKNCGRGSESWQCLGSAIRQAQELDLHHVTNDAIKTSPDDVEKALLQMWELEHRKRLWATLFILDSHMAIALGKPRTIHREDCTTSMPLDCDYPSEPSKTIPMPTNHLQQPPNEFSPTLFWVAISHKFHDMMSLRAHRGTVDYSKIQLVNDEAVALLSALPPALHPENPNTIWDDTKLHLPAVRQRILTILATFLLTLHRPYISKYVSSRNAAIEAAFSLLQAQQQIFNLISTPHYKLYGHSFYTLDAAIFLSAMAINTPADLILTDRVQRQLDLAITRLSMMKERNPLAKSGELILRHCRRIIDLKSQTSLMLGSDNNFSDWLPSMEIPWSDSNLLLHDFTSRTPHESAQYLVSLMPISSTEHQDCSGYGSHDGNLPDYLPGNRNGNDFQG